MQEVIIWVFPQLGARHLFLHSLQSYQQEDNAVYCNCRSINYNMESKRQSRSSTKQQIQHAVEVSRCTADMNTQCYSRVITRLCHKLRPPNVTERSHRCYQCE